MSNKKFYICPTCGNIVSIVRPSGVPLFCCGKKMEELVPNTTDASQEKHVPAVTVEDGAVKVNVGSVDHPMIPEHFIEWVLLETDKGEQLVRLTAGEAPNVTFALGEEKPLAVYAYCNLHGLWKTEL